MSDQNQKPDQNQETIQNVTPSINNPKATIKIPCVRLVGDSGENLPKNSQSHN